MFRSTALLLLLAAPAAFAQVDLPSQTPAPVERNTPAPPQNPYAQRPTPPPAATDLGTISAGQLMTTTHGIATAHPATGILIRIAEHGAVRAVTLDGGHTEFRVEHGIVNISIHQAAQNSSILVDLPGGQVDLVTDGLYTFNADTNTLRVLHGEAAAYTDANAKPLKVKEDHAVTFGTTPLRSIEFNPYDAHTDLVPMARGYAYDDGPAYGNGYARGAYGPYGDGFYGYPYYPYPYYAYGYPWGYGGWGYGYGIGFGWGGGWGFRGRR